MSSNAKTDSRKENDIKSEGCEILEIVQFMCNFPGDKEPDRPTRSMPSSNAHMQCVPYPRVFRICPNRPATEITRYIDIDTETGEIDLRASSRQPLPKGKPWWDVQRHVQDHDPTS